MHSGARGASDGRLVEAVEDDGRVDRPETDAVVEGNLNSLELDSATLVSLRDSRREVLQEALGGPDPTDEWVEKQLLKMLEDEALSTCGCLKACLFQDGLKQIDATGVSESAPAGLDNASATTFALPCIYCKSVVNSLMMDN